MPIQLSLKEPISAPYIFINGDMVSLFMPIGGGDSIGLDNTCKTAMELQTFFHGRDHSPSALMVLEDYNKKLEDDILLLEQTGTFKNLLESKKIRQQQIKLYIGLLKIHQSTFVTQHEPYPQLPLSVQLIFANKIRNCFSVHLCPEVPDFLLRTTNPTFSLKRLQPVFDERGYLVEQEPDSFGGFGPSLRKEIAKVCQLPQNQIDETSAKAKIILALQDSYEHIFKEWGQDVDVKKAKIGEEVFEGYLGSPELILQALQVGIQKYIFEKWGQVVDVTKAKIGNDVIDTQYLLDICAVNIKQASLDEIIDVVLNATLSDEFWDSIKNPLEIDKTIPLNMRTEKASMAVQFFLATTNIFCYARGLSSLNFGAFFDEGIREDSAMRIASSFFSKDGTVEDVIFEIIDEHKDDLAMARSLTLAEKVDIKKEFTLNYNIIKNSPHLDEFIIFREDVPGAVFSHQNRMSIPFVELFPGVASLESLAENSRTL